MVSVSQEFMKGTARMACLCSTMSGASSGENQMLGVTQWLRATAISRASLLTCLTVDAGYQLGPQLSSLARILPCGFSMCLIGLPNCIVAGFQERPIQREPGGSFTFL